MRSFCSGYPGSIILGHGHITLPAYREGLTIVSSQRNRVSPYRSPIGVVKL
jgi:hypothetical protein